MKLKKSGTIMSKFFSIKKRLWKKVIISTSIISSVLATGLSTGLMAKKDEVTYSIQSETQNDNKINYYQEINNNTQKIKQKIQETKRSDLLEIISNFNDEVLKKPIIKNKSVSNKFGFQDYNEQYSINNLSIFEKNKIVDLIYDIGSGKININELVVKAEEHNQKNINDLIAEQINVQNNEINNPLIKSKTRYQLINQSSNNIDYSYDELQAFAAFVDPAYLNHLKNRSKYLVSYASILSAVTMAAWGVASYYWAAWWMFGGNVPFAVAATVQAGLMTADMGIAWADYAFNEEMIKNVIDFRGKKIYLLFRESIKGGISIAKIINFLYKNEALIQTGNYIKSTVIFLKNFFKTFTKSTIKQTAAKIGIKAGISSTLWASPIAYNVISLISLILNVNNIIINIFWK